MKQLIVIFLCAFLAYAKSQDGGPYDWNNFLKEIQTTCNDVELRRDQIIKQESSDPTVRTNQSKEVDQMLTRIILIQNMIAYEFRYRDTLDQAQKNLLETYKNKSLRLRQELTDLKKKLQS